LPDNDHEALEQYQPNAQGVPIIQDTIGMDYWSDGKKKVDQGSYILRSGWQNAIQIPFIL